MREVIEFLGDLVENLFTGQVVINFYKGTVGKVQVSKTLKPEELAENKSKSLVLAFFFDLLYSVASESHAVAMPLLIVFFQMKMKGS